MQTSMMKSQTRGAVSVASSSRAFAVPVQRRTQMRTSLRAVAVHAPPPVADTKAKFISLYKKPIAAVYNVVLQELLVQQHFIRYSVNYQYNEIMALGLASVFDQVMDSIPEEERSKIFTAYVTSVSESPEMYRKDAAALEAAAVGLSTADLMPMADGNPIQKALDAVVVRGAAGKFAYNRFFAIGLFRLLELTGAKEPAALEALTKTAGVRSEVVNRDLLMYKNILSRLSASKELMAEFVIREKKKQAEREAEKKAKAEAEANPAPAATEAVKV